jgi:hypothetical protein
MIIRRHITSHCTTKPHEVLKKVRKPDKSSCACCSDRYPITIAASLFERSAAEDRMSRSSSCNEAMSTDGLGVLCDINHRYESSVSDTAKKHRRRSPYCKFCSASINVLFWAWMPLIPFRRLVYSCERSDRNSACSLERRRLATPLKPTQDQ